MRRNALLPRAVIRLRDPRALRGEKMIDHEGREAHEGKHTEEGKDRQISKFETRNKKGKKLKYEIQNINNSGEVQI